MNLLPYPRFLRQQAGVFPLPRNRPLSTIARVRTSSAPDHPEGYALIVGRGGVRIEYRQPAGLRAAEATLRQLCREYGHRLPCLEIRDWPDFARRGVLLDVSRGRVPKLATLLDLAERLADFKINELQLYVEHTFAYRRYRSAWQDWGALTGAEMRRLDRRCRELGIDLVPNQNSFGHLRYLLAHPRLRHLAEVSQPYESEWGDFLRHPSTLAPNHPGTRKLLRELYDELLPNFSSAFFNVGGDETWDLGRGQSATLCARLGKGKVYADFLRMLHREVTRRKRRMMFWGDIILTYPELLPQLPRNLIALNWGYEADHPFAEQAATFAQSGLQFYVCPGTSTWMTLIGRHDNAFANLRAAAKAGRQHGASGYLNCDWGDGGHPQPLAVSWPLYAAGAGLSWCARTFTESQLAPVLNRDIYHDPRQQLAQAALELGRAHLKFGYRESNLTPFGTVIAAPPPDTRELFCRNGLKLYARISSARIAAARTAVQRQRRRLRRGRPATTAGKLLQRELDLAARMAEQSCHFMQWQQALAVGRTAEARTMARAGLASLECLAGAFSTYWRERNKATPKHCTAFLQWRRADYRSGKNPAPIPKSG